MANDEIGFYHYAAEIINEHEIGHATTCQAIYLSVRRDTPIEEMIDMDFFKNLKKEFAKWFKPPGSGAWWFENEDCNYEEEQNHRMMALLLMQEIADGECP